MQIAPNLIQFDAFAQPPKKNKDFKISHYHRIEKKKIINQNKTNENKVLNEK